MKEHEKTEWEDVDWRSYQDIVAGLHAMDEDVSVEEEYEYPVNSGGTKEIDVVVWDNTGHYETTILIECKFHKSRISQQVVDSVSGYLNRTDADKAVIISKEGFQEGAVQRARGSNIELWTLRQLRPETDLQDGEVRYIDLDLNVGKPDIKVKNAKVKPLDKDDEHIEEEIQYEFNPYNSRLYNLQGEPTEETLVKRINNLLHSKDEGEYTEEFKNKAVLIRGDFYQIEFIEYEITYSSLSIQNQMDLLEPVDTIFKNELSKEKEFISLSNALNSFTEEVK